MGELQAKIERVQATAYRIPTDKPESDGTFQWDSTTLVVVTASHGNTQGLGYTYSDASMVGLIEGALAKAIRIPRAIRIACSSHAMRLAIAGFSSMRTAPIR